jgi:SnoaL-like domain
VLPADVSRSANRASRSSAGGGGAAVTLLGGSAGAGCPLKMGFPLSRSLSRSSKSPNDMMGRWTRERVSRSLSTGEGAKQKWPRIKKRREAERQTIMGLSCHLGLVPLLLLLVSGSVEGGRGAEVHQITLEDAYALVSHYTTSVDALDFDAVARVFCSGSRSVNIDYSQAGGCNGTVETALDFLRSNLPWTGPTFHYISNPVLVPERANTARVYLRNPMFGLALGPLAEFSATYEVSFAKESMASDPLRVDGWRISGLKVLVKPLQAWSPTPRGLLLILGAMLLFFRRRAA